MKFVFVASLLNMHYLVVRAKIGWLGIRIMFQSGRHHLMECNLF